MYVKKKSASSHVALLRTASRVPADVELSSRACSAR
jgi:hypothetical protein